MNRSLVPTERQTVRDLATQIHQDYVAHGSDWTLPGFRAVAVHRFGCWRMGLEPKLLRAPFSVLYRMLYRRARNLYGIELPYSVELGQRVVFEHQGGVVIHGASTIGDDCVIRHGVTLGIRGLQDLDAAPALGSRVEVGAGAAILGNVHVEDDARIGANAVVVDDVAAGQTVVGAPARPVLRPS